MSVNVGDELLVSFLGYQTENVKITTNNDYTVHLKPKVDELDEVTVVAFAKQKKESVISSVTTVKPSELKVPSSNLTTALAGRMSGVIAYQTSGEPGKDDASFFIRGVTTFGYAASPLILIDNVELTTADLARLNVDDIASFSIMKDATATALYGARGANGVILVTTKEGKEGKATVNIRIENSVSTPVRTIETADYGAAEYVSLNASGKIDIPHCLQKRNVSFTSALPTSTPRRRSNNRHLRIGNAHKPRVYQNPSWQTVPDGRIFTSTLAPQ